MIFLKHRCADNQSQNHRVAQKTGDWLLSQFRQMLTNLHNAFTMIVCSKFNTSASLKTLPHLKSVAAFLLPCIFSIVLLYWFYHYGE